MNKILSIIKIILHKIEEPRVMRAVQFAMYITMIVLGSAFLLDLPQAFEGFLGTFLSLFFGWLITGGGFLGAIGILPGYWAIERLGIISLWTGLAIYLIVVLVVNGSPIGIAISLFSALALVNRWLLEYYRYGR